MGESELQTELLDCVYAKEIRAITIADSVNMCYFKEKSKMPDTLKNLISSLSLSLSTGYLTFIDNHASPDLFSKKLHQLEIGKIYYSEGFATVYYDDPADKQKYVEKLIISEYEKHKVVLDQWISVAKQHNVELPK